MTWDGYPVGRVAGFVPVILTRGDTLARLAEETGVDAVTIAAANGVDVDPRGRTCAWARDVEQWVLAPSLNGVAGRRLPLVKSQPNVCSPGEGFAAFVEGQSVYAPVGVDRVRLDEEAAPTRSSNTGGFIAAGLGFLALIVAARRRRQREK